MVSSFIWLFFFLLVEGEGPEIKPNPDYPEWLFKIDLKPKRALEDMDPDVDKWEYWKEYKKRQKEEVERYEYLKFKHISLQNSPSVAKHRVYSRYKYMLKA